MKKETLRQLIENNTELLLLDIREMEELTDTPTIEGAIHMPMGKVFTKAFKGRLPKEKQIIVFCRSDKHADSSNRVARLGLLDRWPRRRITDLHKLII